MEHLKYTCHYVQHGCSDGTAHMFQGLPNHSVHRHDQSIWNKDAGVANPYSVRPWGALIPSLTWMKRGCRAKHTYPLTPILGKPTEEARCRRKHACMRPRQSRRVQTSSIYFSLLQSYQLEARLCCVFAAEAAEAECKRWAVNDTQASNTSRC